MARLLHVTADRLIIWPLNIHREHVDYLKPRHGTIERLIFARRVSGPYLLPQTSDDVTSLLEELPAGFAKDYRLGLGVLWEYRAIVDMIATMPGVDTLFVHGGDRVWVDPPFFTLGADRFQSLRKEVRSIATRYQRDARKEKNFVAYESLLHSADPSRFPKQTKRIRPDAIAELTRGGFDHSRLSRRDQTAAVRLVQDSVVALSESQPRALMALKSEIEIVSLEQLIRRFDEMLATKAKEEHWQRLFTENPFILSMAFAIPVMLIRGQAYAGGKSIDNTEGRIADFLMASVATGNLALIEIKHPDCDLLGRRPYRGESVYGPSTDLGGAISQVLDQRLNLQKQLPILKDIANRNDIHGHSVRCIVIIGRTPQDHHQKKSFELIRNAMSGVDIVTFDEICGRLTNLRSALTPAPFEPPF